MRKRGNDVSWCDMIADVRTDPRGWPSCTNAKMTPELAVFLASRVDQAFSMLAMADGRPSLEHVVDWLETVAHGMRVHADGGDPCRTLPPRLAAKMEAIGEAIQRMVDKEEGS